jgi:hypothetical protein
VPPAYARDICTLEADVDTFRSAPDEAKQVLAPLMRANVGALLRLMRSAPGGVGDAETAAAARVRRDEAIREVRRCSRDTMSHFGRIIENLRQEVDGPRPAAAPSTSAVPVVPDAPAARPPTAPITPPA